jgi:predicted house-cleaning noncanonical NTP pyrophosphatase (MazG superfamily)
MRIEYNKLIRDRIPEIIEKDGKKFAIEVMGDNDYQQALFSKLVEEAQEAVNSKPEKLLIELADLLEVIHALMRAFDIDPDELKKIQQHRKMTRGSFDKKLKLLWTE